MADKDDVKFPWPGVLYKVSLNVEREHGAEGKKIQGVEEFRLVISKGDAVTAARAAAILAEKHAGSMTASGTKFVSATVLSVAFECGVWAVDLGHEN